MLKIQSGTIYSDGLFYFLLVLMEAQSDSFCSSPWSHRNNQLINRREEDELLKPTERNMNGNILILTSELLKQLRFEALTPLTCLNLLIWTERASKPIHLLFSVFPA